MTKQQSSSPAAFATWRNASRSGLSWKYHRHHFPWMFGKHRMLSAKDVCPALSGPLTCSFEDYSHDAKLETSTPTRSPWLSVLTTRPHTGHGTQDTRAFTASCRPGSGDTHSPTNSDTAPQSGDVTSCETSSTDSFSAVNLMISLGFSSPSPTSSLEKRYEQILTVVPEAVTSYRLHAQSRFST